MISARANSLSHLSGDVKSSVSVQFVKLFFFWLQAKMCLFCLVVTNFCKSLWWYLFCYECIGGD